MTGGTLNALGHRRSRAIYGPVSETAMTAGIVTASDSLPAAKTMCPGAYPRFVLPLRPPLAAAESLRHGRPPCLKAAIMAFILRDTTLRHGITSTRSGRRSATVPSGRR